MTSLNWSVGLFLAAAAFHMLIGALTPIVAPRSSGTTFLFTERADGEAIGDSTQDILAQYPGLDHIRQAFFGVLGAFLLMVGTLEGAIAWFGLRSGHTWALGALAAAALLGAVLWTYVLAQYWEAGAHPGLGEIPPFMWVPALLHVPAIALGWVGLRAGT